MKKKIKKRGLKKKGFCLKDEFLQGWKFLQESQNYVWLSFLFFILFFALGFLFFYIAPESQLNPILDMINTYIKELLKEIEGLGFFGMFRYIFVNNASIGFLSMASGFALSIIPIFLLVTNGLVIGFISGIAYSDKGFVSLLALLPHGIFEIPAIMISLGLGIKFGTFIFKKERKKLWKFYLVNFLRVFFLIVVPLLVVASLIESALIIFIGG